MTSREACTLYDLIDCSTENDWPHIRREMIDRGYTAREIVEACKCVSGPAHKAELITENNFIQ